MDVVVGFLAGLAAHPLLAAGSALAILGGSYASSGALHDQPVTTVQSVVDGDTIWVVRGEDRLKVRLLNIDTPESVDPDKPEQCLAVEASAFLRQRLPAGTQVELQYDRERRDRYGRDLAGVFVQGDLVNAEIARAGLGAAVLFGENDRFFDQVLAAQQQAEHDHVGLHSPEVACTLEAQVAAYERRTAAAGRAPAPTADLASFDARGQEFASLTADGQGLQSLLEVQREQVPSAVLTDRSRALLLNRLHAALRTAAGLQQDNGRARGAEVERQRLAAEEAARKAAEEQARQVAQAAAAQQERQRAADEAREPAAPESPGPAGERGSDQGAAPPSAGGAEPWNSPGPDLDCSDIGHPVLITGPDHHGLDRDGDGAGCESYG